MIIVYPFNNAELITVQSKNLYKTYKKNNVFTMPIYFVSQKKKKSEHNLKMTSIFINGPTRKDIKLILVILSSEYVAIYNILYTIYKYKVIVDYFVIEFVIVKLKLV